jgi:hypothetical protein
MGRRAHRHVRAAFENQRGRSLGKQEYREEGLGHQRNCTGAAGFFGHIERICARINAAGRKGQGGSGDGSAGELGPGYPGQRLNRSEMLGTESRLGAARADINEANSGIGEGSQGQGRAQYLTAPFTMRPVQDEHGGN